VNVSERNEQSVQRTFHRCFLSSSVHLATRFQRRRFFLNSSNQKRELPVVTMCFTDQDEISNLDRGPFIYASYQVSVHLAKGFQRRRLKCEKFTDGRRTPSDGNSSRCLWQGELTKNIGVGLRLKQ
jgi:hypothetical protein